MQLKTLLNQINIFCYPNGWRISTNQKTTKKIKDYFKTNRLNIKFFTGYDSAYEIILNLFGEFLDEYSYIQLCDLIDGGSINES